MTERERTEKTNDEETEELQELVDVLAYMGCVWWSVFALISLYWAVGGTTGAWTLWGGSGQLSGVREPWIDQLLWTTGVLKFVPAVLSLALARRSTRLVLSPVVNACAFLVGLTLVPYVAVDAVVRGFVLLGLLDAVVRYRIETVWHLLFWNPWWVLGVILFCVTAWLSQYAIGGE